MRRKTEKKKATLRMFIRSGVTPVYGIWAGSSERPIVPQIISQNVFKPPRRKRKVPRALRRRWRTKK